MNLNTNSFLKLLKEKDFLNNNALIEVQNIIDKYPFFNVPYIIKAKILKELKSNNFINSLQQAVLYTLSRERLYEIIHEDLSKNFQQKHELKETNFERIISEETSIINEENLDKDLKYNEKNIKEIKTNFQVKDTYSYNQTFSNFKIINENELNEEKNKNLPVLTKDLEEKENLGGYFFVQNSTLSFTFHKKELIITNNEEQHFNNKDFLKNFQNSNNLSIDNILEKIKYIIESRNNDIVSSYNQIDYNQTEYDNENNAEIDYNDNFEVITETYASILEKQGNYKKAIKIYEKLILKYPEKISYFVDKIIALKEKI